MQREVTDAEGTTWTCAQAFAGLGEQSDAARAAAEKLAEKDGHVAVVATPSGGAQTVRLELPPDWHERMGDEELAAAIAGTSAWTSTRRAGRSSCTTSTCRPAATCRTAT